MSLEDAIRSLHLQGEISMNGRWARLEGERFAFYVVELSYSRGYFTWCDHPSDRIVEHHPDPFTAVLSGLRRASRPDDDPVTEGD